MLHVLNFHFEMASMHLLKIQIPVVPYKIGSRHYNYMIAVFDKFIVFKRGVDDIQWMISRNDNLAP
jgi:hypothetical protein